MLKSISKIIVPAGYTPNSAPPARNLRDVPWVCGVLLLAMLMILGGCGRRPGTEITAESTAHPHQDLLIGYSMLADALSNVSNLNSLRLFKILTLKGPNDAIDKMMKTLSEASKGHGAELLNLRRLAPDVSDKPAVATPIGDAISAVAIEFGKSEMLSRTDGFDIRFLLLQAQSTRMIAAMAMGTARFEPNPLRKEWLKNLADEYEGYRNEMIKYLGGRKNTR